MRALAAPVLALGLTASAALADGPVVVELYTSQGCASCPPADAMLQELALREDVIALALHVDYWDYIGWADVFAQPEFDDRQRGFARAAGQRTIYTPQMIVNGTDRVVGARAMDLADAIARHRASSNGVTVELEREGNRLRILCLAEPARAEELVVQIVRYNPEETVSILRGENAGKTFSYSQIVTDWQVIGRWDASEPMETEIVLEGDEPVVVIVQQADYGPILAAARLR